VAVGGERVEDLAPCRQVCQVRLDPDNTSCKEERKQNVELLKLSN
jgi:hypothetical protein